MTLIDEILARRKSHKLYDEELWNFIGPLKKRPLQNMSDDALQTRLSQIEKNIQYLDIGPTGINELRPERGWLSPWWWLGLRHWTITEMELRSVAPIPSVQIEPMRPVRREFVGVHGGGPLKLFRISRSKFLLETIEKVACVSLPPAATRK